MLTEREVSSPLKKETRRGGLQQTDLSWCSEAQTYFECHQQNVSRFKPLNKLPPNT